MECNKILFSDHIISQMFKRSISTDDVKYVLGFGEIIKEYVSDKPYPSYLILGYINERPLHILVAREEETGTCIMVTTYEPDSRVWSEDFRTKVW